MRLQRTQVTWSQLRVGIFTTICLAVVFWFFLFSENGLRAIRRQFTVQTILDSASGVKSGDPVRLAGIEVGEVQKVEFVRREGRDKVRIQITLDKNAAQYLRSDSIIDIKSVGLTNNRLIEISLGTSKGVPVVDGVTLAGTAPLDTAVVLNRAIALSDSMNSFLVRFEGLIDHLQSGEGHICEIIEGRGVISESEPGDSWRLPFNGKVE